MTRRSQEQFLIVLGLNSSSLLGFCYSATNVNSTKTLPWFICKFFEGKEPAMFLYTHSAKHKVLFIGDIQGVQCWLFKNSTYYERPHLIGIYIIKSADHKLSVNQMVKKVNLQCQGEAHSQWFGHSRHSYWPYRNFHTCAQGVVIKSIHCNIVRENWKQPKCPSTGVWINAL